MTLLACCDCGCTDIQQTSWTMVNTGGALFVEDLPGQIWCPRCGGDVDTWVEVDAIDPYIETESMP